MSKYRFFRRHPGEGTPMILAIVLVLLMLFCTVAEFSRVWIIAQGVKEAAQQAVISTINDNYDDVYHAVREGYAAGWYAQQCGSLFHRYGSLWRHGCVLSHNGDESRRCGSEHDH